MFVWKVFSLVIKASHLLQENHTVVSRTFFFIFLCTSNAKYLTGLEKSDSEILQRAFLKLFTF
jgi:hypothetical protein